MKKNIAAPGKIYHCAGHFADMLHRAGVDDLELQRMNVALGDSFWLTIKDLIRDNLVLENRRNLTDLNPIITVDRSLDTMFLKNLGESNFAFIHPELHARARHELNVNDFKDDLPVFGPEPVSVRSLYNQHVANGWSGYTLDLHELMAIEERGLDFYRFMFNFKVIPAWRSIREGNGKGFFQVPCLVESDDSQNLRITWVSSEFKMDDKYPYRRLSRTNTTPR